MHDIILHHYPLSLFAEKIRKIFAYKNVPWRSVTQPMMAPKPGLSPLTGGYRKIPVLQIGADIYCDTSCIARRIEQLHPDPACIPEDRRGLVGILEDWADHRFTSQVVPAVVLELLPELPSDILEDRAKMSPMLSRQSLTAMAPHTRAQSLLSFDLLEARLAEHEYLAGTSFTLADAACFHPLWFLAHAPALFDAVRERPRLSSWFDRVSAITGGRATGMSAAEALEIARDSEPADIRGIEARPSPIATGQTVAVRADDIGTEEVRGTLVRATADEWTIQRQDPQVGAVAVHFPRSGYVVFPVAS